MSLSLCITCCDLDFHLLDGLLIEFQKQTIAPNEIIISSSGISDESLDKYKSLEINERTTPIKVVNNPKRHFQSVARNLGAASSSFKYIMFFDVDDFPHPEKIELCMHNIKGLDLLLHNYFPNHEHDSFSYSDVPILSDLLINSSCTNLRVSPDRAIHHSHITVKRSIFNSIKYNESIDFYRKEDGKFCQDLVNSGYKGKYLNLPLVNYTS